jgi:hypothetical protein
MRWRFELEPEPESEPEDPNSMSHGLVVRFPRRRIDPKKIGLGSGLDRASSRRHECEAVITIRTRPARELHRV